MTPTGHTANHKIGRFWQKNSTFSVYREAMVSSRVREKSAVSYLVNFSR